MNRPARLDDELTIGRRALRTIFCNSPPLALKAGELLAAATDSSDGIYHLLGGWACQFHDLPNGRRVIIDIYLPGDVIGLDAVLRNRPPEPVLALTSATIEVSPATDALIDLIGSRPTALYAVWLLGQRLQRADRRLAAISGLDARGRLAMMVLDFYARLRRKRLTTGPVYYLPLTQIQIGDYLGLTVVHVNRVLRSLRAEGIVHLEKHCVTILDLDRLTSLAQNGDAMSSAARGGKRTSNEIAISIGEAAD